MSLTAEEFETLTDMLNAIEAEMGALNQWEQGFIKDQLARVEKYGANIHMSPKQWNAVKKIHFGLTGSDGQDYTGRDDDDQE